MDSMYSWLICAMCFIAQASTCGFYNSYGALLIAIIEEYNISETLAALIASVSYSLCLLYGGLTSPLSNRFGCRQVAVAGAIVYGGGLLLASFSEGVVMLFAMFGVLFPLGASAVYFASLMVLPQHFEGYYSLAVGIATSGVGAGGFAFSALIEFSLKAYGLKSTFRILAGTAILLFVGGMIYGKTPKRFSNVGSNRARPKLFDAKIWKNRAFLIWTITVCLLFMVLYIPFVHLVKRGTDLGISFSKASLLLGYISVASCVGKVFFGKLSDLQWVNRLYLIQITVLIGSVNQTLCPLFTSYESLVIYCIIYGFFDGCFGALLAIIVGDIVGRENLHSAIGAMYMLSSLFLMVGPPLAGVLYSVSSSYDSSFFTIGAVMAISCCLMFLIPLFLPKRPVVKVIADDEMSDSSAELPDKKNSWVTYDSGIDLTIKDTSSFECTIDGEGELASSKSSSIEAVNERRFFSFLDRYIRTRRRTLVPGNLVNTYAVSTLELNAEQLQVVDRVTIV